MNGLHSPARTQACPPCLYRNFRWERFLDQTARDHHAPRGTRFHTRQAARGLGGTVALSALYRVFELFRYLCF